jgi:hypothetical protein
LMPAWLNAAHQLEWAALKNVGNNAFERET